MQLKFILLLCLVITLPSMTFADNDFCLKKAAYAKHIKINFSEQLLPPPQKYRRVLSQFGYNLQLFRLPVFPITDFLPPDNYGIHSYNKEGSREKNGVIYTCRGGFIDFSHLRTGADWTVYVAFKVLSNYCEFELPAEAGSLHLQFQGLDELSVEDIAAIAAKISFERLLWHEAASWYYHRPNHTLGEQRSAFTPEDVYSNLLGALIGKNIVIRILNTYEELPYSQIATEEIQKVLRRLQPLDEKRESKLAYDIVDRNKQMKLPPPQRNKDIWYDSKIIFQDQRYSFKRYMDIGPSLVPWLVPHSDRLGCVNDSGPVVLTVPQNTKSGASFYKHYSFFITPDSSLFYSKKNGKQLHAPFEPFSTRNFRQAINQITQEMEQVLLPGFDERDHFDPVPYYAHIRKVWFK